MKEKKQESPTDQKSEADRLTEDPLYEANATSCFPMLIKMFL